MTTEDDLKTAKEIEFLLELASDDTLRLEFKTFHVMATMEDAPTAMAGFLAVLQIDPTRSPTVAAALAAFRQAGTPGGVVAPAVVGDVNIKKMTQEQINWLLKGSKAPIVSLKAKDKAVRNAVGKPQASLNAELKKTVDGTYFAIAVVAGKPLQKNIYDSQSPLGKKIPFAIYAILEHPKTHDFKVGYFPIISQGEKNIITLYSADQEAEAIADFHAYPTDLSIVQNPFATIQSLLPKLRTLLAITTRNIIKADFLQNNLSMGFPLILALYHETSSSTLKNDLIFITEIDRLSRLIRSKSLIDAKLNSTARAAIIRQWLPPLAFNVAEADGSFVTARTMLKRICMIKECLAKAHKHFGSLFSEYAFDVGDIIDSETKAFMNDKTNMERFNLSDNYPALPLNTVKILLAAAFKTNQMLYNRIILQLSTCLRNEEINRLNPKHLLPNGTLDYSERPAAGLEQLSQKTAPKRNGSATVFVNPPTSVVTRVIMKGGHKFSKRTDLKKGDEDIAFNAFEKAEALFWEPGGEIRKLLSAAFKDALLGDDSATTELQGRDALQADRTHQRTLRTTGATMLRYGLTSRICIPIEPKVISERMAHIDGTMIEKVYANGRPIDSKGSQTPDDYITIDALEIEGPDGKLVKIADNEYLWDAWLLEEFFTRYAAGSKQEAKKIAQQIFDELTKSSEGKHVPKRTRVKL